MRVIDGVTFLSVPEVAKQLDLSSMTIIRYASNGRMKACGVEPVRDQINGRLFFRETEVRALVNQYDELLREACQ